MEFPAVNERTRTARRAVSLGERRDVSLAGVIDWRMRLKLVRVLSHLAVNAVILIAMVLISFASFRVALAAEEALPAEDGRQLALVRPNDMNSGALLLPSKEQGRFVEAPRLSTDVDMRINGPIARITVTQRFENPGDGWVEGIYVFPLPEMSAVDTLRMRIGDRLIEGIIKVREEARKIFEQAKREGKKAALLEQQRENLFTNNVANIGPGETVIIEIEYQQTVKLDKGLFSLRFPMVVAPRYSPEPIIQTVDFKRNGEGGDFGVIDPVPDRDKIEAPILDPRENAKMNPVRMTIKLAAGFPIGRVKSPYHSLTEREQDASTRILTLQNESVPADRDFVLEWRAKGAAPNAALFREMVNGKEYILAFVTPPELPVDELPKKDRDVIFVIDNSGSMAGESIAQAKAALGSALNRLEPADHFNIVRFDDTLEILFDDAVPADNENIGAALRFVRGLEAEGGTEMLPALRAALVDRSASGSDRIRQVVFITDGAIGNEQQLFDQIAQGRGRSRIFTVGIGSAPNSFFMTRAAEMGRGTFTHIGAVMEVREKMQRFFEKLENPVMTGLSVQGIGTSLSEASPDPLPDLYLGEPVILSAIVEKTGPAEGSQLELSGEYAGQPWKVRMDLSNSAEGEGVGKLWARRKIASLEASKSYGADMNAIDRNIENVALNHHLVSRRTSLVAVDVEVARPSDEKVDTRKVPLNLPAGWDADKWFADEAEQAPAPQKAGLDRMRSQTRMLMAAAPSAEGAAAIAKQNRQSVTLPQTATDAEKRILIGLLIMLLGAALLFVNQMMRLLARDVEKAALRSRRSARNRLPW